MRWRPDLARTRRIARAMLLVWLFALGAQWVHACVVAPHLAAHAAVPQQGADDDHAPGAAQRACLNFCAHADDGVTKSTLHDSGAAPVPVAFAAAWPAWPDARRTAALPAAAEPPPGPPVAIAFLRLTI